MGQIKHLHEVNITAALGDKNEQVSPLLAKRLKEPHLAVMVGPNEWIHVVPGMIIALVTNREHVDGVAPFIITKVSTKPGKEYIDLVAFSTNPENRRKLRLGARYSGHYASAVTSADQAIDASVAAVKGDKNEI